MSTWRREGVGLKVEEHVIESVIIFHLCWLQSDKEAVCELLEDREFFSVYERHNRTLITY